MENSVKVPQKTKYRFSGLNIESPYDPAIPHLDLYSKIIENTKMYTGMFKAALFIIGKKWKQPKFLSVD